MHDKTPVEKELDGMGFDASLIDANLRLDPEARALRHQGAFDLVIALAARGKEIRGEPERTPAATVRR